MWSGSVVVQRSRLLASLIVVGSLVAVGVVGAALWAESVGGEAARREVRISTGAVCAQGRLVAGWLPDSVIFAADEPLPEAAVRSSAAVKPPATGAGVPPAREGMEARTLLTREAYRVAQDLIAQSARVRGVEPAVADAALRVASDDADGPQSRFVESLSNLQYACWTEGLADDTKGR